MTMKDQRQPIQRPDEAPQSIQEQLQGMFEEKDTSGQVEAIKTMFDPKDVKMKTEVSKDKGEIQYFSKLYLLAGLLDVPEFKEYADEFLTLAVSNERKGRREAVAMIRQTDQQEQKRGLMSWFR